MLTFEKGEEISFPLQLVLLLLLWLVTTASSSQNKK
jgi:hypothetical protein